MSRQRTFVDLTASASEDSESDTGSIKTEPADPRDQSPRPNEQWEDESEDIDGVRRIDEGKFRLSAKWVFLTYSDMANKPDLADWKIYFERKGATAGVISRERHRSGKWHIHALLENHNKWNVVNPRAFDNLGYHPNIKSLKRNSFERVEEYVIKDGDFLKWHLRHVTMCPFHPLWREMPTFYQHATYDSS